MTELMSTDDRPLHRLVDVPHRAPAAITVPQLAPGTRVPLNSSQASIWFQTQLHPTSTEYNSFHTFVHRSDLGPEQLRSATRQLLERHDALRVRVLEAAGVPVQEDVGPFEPPLAWHDMRAMPVDEAEDAALGIAVDALREWFDLCEQPPWRVTAIRLPDERTLVVLVVHHIIMDHWSWEQVLSDLVALIAGEPDSLRPPPPTGFVDYVAWRAGTRDEQAARSEMDYWLTQLGGELPVLDVPRDHPRPLVPSRRGHFVPVEIPPAIVEEARRLAGQEGTTLFVVILAAYKVLLMRLSGQSDVIVGTALAGRDDEIAEELVGCFVRLVALRSHHPRQASFRESVRAVHDVLMDALDNQAVPFDEIVSALNVPRDLAVHPVVQTYFGMQSLEFDYQGPERIDLALLERHGMARWELGVSLFETPHGIEGGIEAFADLFDVETVARFAQCYAALLASLLASPDQALGRAAMLRPDERRTILSDLNAYSRPTHQYSTLAQPFEVQAERTPDAIALVGDEGELSYLALNEGANRFARYLRNIGVGVGDRVALCLDRSFDMVTAIYAVAKTGAAYVPLDPALPEGRLAYMLDDAQPVVVITETTHEARLSHGGRQVVVMDAARHEWAAEAGTNLGLAVPCGAFSHLLYTSGSTGRPKAVACAVDSSVADILWMQQQYPFEPCEHSLLKTSFGFDVSLWELFWPLYAGATVVVVAPDGHRDVRLLAELIERFQVPIVYLIPTLLQAFVDELAPGRCQSLRWMLSGGEPITPRLRDEVHRRLDAGLVNGYGPTETGCATDMVVPREAGAPVVPLGRPAANFRCYVLDHELAVQPIGVPGELYLGGEVGVHHGYFARPGLTAERFVPDPFGLPGHRMYRTGDICRMRADGVLEHLGRLGRQVKVRGMRVELAEVEAVVMEEAGITACVAMPVEHNGVTSLVAFVVFADGCVVDAADIRQRASRMLPEHMVPTWIQSIDEVPVSLNGKTDHAALLGQWEGARHEPREIVQPADDTEAAVVAMFKDALELNEVSVLESFFALGGHSLLIFRVIGECEATFGVRPTVADFFTAPSPRELAGVVRAIAEAER